MRYLVTAAEMREYDRNTIEKTGIPACVLMERAALAAAESRAIFSRLSTHTVTRLRSASCASRASFPGSTIWLAIRISFIPPAARSSASPSLAQVIPFAPASIWRRARYVHLWDL